MNALDMMEILSSNKAVVQLWRGRDYKAKWHCEVTANQRTGKGGADTPEEAVFSAVCDHGGRA